MTPKGVDSLFFSIYHDINRGRNALGLSNARLKTLGVYQPLIVNLNSQSKGTAIRSRLGITYPPQRRQWMLEHMNPFQYLPSYEKREIGLFARGMVRRALQSEGQQDRLLARALGLAQFCGLGEISLADLMELLVHACHYEKIARRYLAADLGVHHSIFTGYALRDCLPGPQLGSLQNPIENFAQIAPTFYDSLVPIGVIERGKPRINRAEEMRNVRFRIDGGTFITEGEPVYMISGWASALHHRPQNHPQNRSTARDFTVGFLRELGMELVPPPARLRVGNLSGKVSGHDVHGNPHYFSAELETVRVNIKRTPGGQLVGKVATFGDFKPIPFGGQGVFGVPCGCNAPDRSKLLDKSHLKKKLVNMFRYRLGQGLPMGYEKVLCHWTAGDIPLILFWLDGFIMGTYIQVAGECMYCATTRAFGSGCTNIVAGAW